MKDLIKDLRLFYGITNDIFKAGYIDPDGYLLDFSGKNIKYSLYSIEGYNRKNLLHGDIIGINTDGFCLIEKYPSLLLPQDNIHQLLLKNLGFVRVSSTMRQGNVYISYVSINTNQKLAIYKYCKGYHVVIDQIDYNESVIREEDLYL